MCQSLFNNVPFEIILKILTYLSYYDIISYILTCKNNRQLIYDEYFWKIISLSHFNVYIDLRENKNFTPIQNYLYIYNNHDFINLIEILKKNYDITIYDNPINDIWSLQTNNRTNTFFNACTQPYINIIFNRKDELIVTLNINNKLVYVFRDIDDEIVHIVILLTKPLFIEYITYVNNINGILSLLNFLSEKFEILGAGARLLMSFDLINEKKNIKFDFLTHQLYYVTYYLTKRSLFKAVSEAGKITINTDLMSNRLIKYLDNDNNNGDLKIINRTSLLGANNNLMTTWEKLFQYDNNNVRFKYTVYGHSLFDDILNVGNGIEFSII